MKKETTAFFGKATAGKGKATPSGNTFPPFPRETGPDIGISTMPRPKRTHGGKASGRIPEVQTKPFRAIPRTTKPFRPGDFYYKFFLSMSG